MTFWSCDDIAVASVLCDANGVINGTTVFLRLQQLK